MQNVKVIAEQVQALATDAALFYINNELGGKDCPLCGFAWVVVIAQHRGNSRVGRLERAILEELGFEKSEGRSYTLFSPGHAYVQNADANLEAAKAAASHIRSVAINVDGMNFYFQPYVQSRLD